MKTAFLAVTAWCFQGVVTAFADGAKDMTQVVERFVGSNPEAYAILRIETDGPDAGGTSRTKTWLNEYSKTPPAGQTLKERLAAPASYGNPEINDGWYAPTGKMLVRSTLLADISRTTDPDASVNPSAPKVMVHESSTGPSMPDVMLRYPIRIPAPWSEEDSGRLRCEDYSRTTICGSLTVIGGEVLTERLFGGVRSTYDGKIDYGKLAVVEVADDGNTLFVTVSRTMGTITSTAIVCVPPELSAHVRNLASSEEYYLCAGTFKSRTEAFNRAKELREKAKGDPSFQGHEVEIWSGYDMNYCFTIYSVVISHSMEVVRKRQVAKFEEVLGARLVLRSSQRYQIRLAEESGDE